MYPSALQPATPLTPTSSHRSIEPSHPLNDPKPDHGSGSGSDSINNNDGGGGGGDGGSNNQPRWITIATFSLPTEAHLARLRLESEDIDCVIVDEHLVSTNWLLSPAIGGIKIQVPEDQVAHARTVLKTDSIPWDESDALELARCPKCGVGEFAPAEPPRWVLAVSILLLGIPLLFLPKVWRCTHCLAPMESTGPTPP